MERDFIGGRFAAVKQEICDEEEIIIDAAPVRSLAMQWSFSNKGGGSVVPQMYSFHGGGSEDTDNNSFHNKTRTGFDALTSNGLVTITTTTNTQNHHPTVVPEKQGRGGVRYSVTTYPAANLPHNKHTNNILSDDSFLAAASPRLQPAASANDIIMPCSTTTSTPIVGTTDLRNNSSKISRAPAQLTIFYNGSVCVYDNISSEKAQAIMLLAGNGPPSTTTTTPVQAALTPNRTCSSFQEGLVSSSSNYQPNSYAVTTTRLSPVPVSSRPIPSHQVSHSTASRSGLINYNSGATKNQRLARGVLLSPPSSYKSEESAVMSVTPLRSIPPPTTSFVPSGTGNAVPQFRKKSLARFLEKRKERVICTSSPYEKEYPEGAQESRTSLSPNSSGSCHVIGSINN